jgi:hypothetical protein
LGKLKELKGVILRVKEVKEVKEVKGVKGQMSCSSKLPRPQREKAVVL